MCSADAIPKPPGPFWKDRRQLLTLAVVLSLSFLVFLPALNNGFVNWDDQANLYKNPQILNISDSASFFSSLWEIFSNHLHGNYNPLSLASFAVEKLLFGLDEAFWYHLDNILLHLVCVLLVFRISLALGLKLLPAAFCALLFGIQPMRVESVVWVTERKDVLFGSFYLLAFYYYLKAIKAERPKAYRLVIMISFTLALLSKIQAVALPLAMLLVDYYYDRKLELKRILEKWPYFALSLATGLVGIYFLRVDGGIQNNALFGFFERLFIGAYGYCVYLIKSLFPYRMVPVYPYPAELSWPFYLSMLAALGVLGMIGYAFLRQQKQIVFGLLFFTVNVMFMLQILGAGQGFLADRFTYIAYFGLFFLYAYSLQRLFEAYPRLTRPTVAAILLVLCVYGVINYRQSKIWQNGETLWSHVLKYSPNSSLVWENRGDYYREQGRIEEAINDFSQALTLKPDNPIAYLSRAALYQQSGEPEQLRLALADYRRALQLAPNDPESYRQSARINFQLRSYGAARSDLENYLQLVPNDPSMWSNLGTASRLTKDYPAAIQAFNRAIKLAPDELSYSYKRALTYYEMGNFTQASNSLRELKNRGYGKIDPVFEQLLQQTR